MNNYQKTLIEEHSQLITRIEKLHNYIYKDRIENDDRVEFANKCIQLAAMKKYEEALRARIENSGIVFENGTYFERVASIEHDISVPKMSEVGSDYDKNGEIMANCSNCCNSNK